MKTSERYTIYIILSIISVIIALSLFNTLVKLDDTNSNLSPPRYGPLPFDRFANKTSFEVVIKAWSSRGLDIYLPTWLPNGLKPVAVWVVIRDGEVGSLAIFCYSREGRDKIDTAELTIEVSTMEGLSFNKSETGEGVVTKIRGWDAYINEKAPVFHEEYQKLYGPYAKLIEVNIGRLNYLFSGAPPITTDDIVKIVESMEPTK
ncbi:hypothetical protein KEJ47_04200 [Candidatus Bathyarchaeota archaeon]|nr:hypothetical protein [Candidatus Bathyarchaeota archaeon]